MGEWIREYVAVGVACWGKTCTHRQQGPSSSRADSSQIQSGFLKEKLLKNVCRNKMGLRPCSASLRAQRSSNNTECSQKARFSSLLKLGSPANRWGRAEAAGPRRGTKGMHSRGVPGVTAKSQPPAMRGQPTLPLALSEDPVPWGEEMETRTPALLTTPPHPLTQPG